MTSLPLSFFFSTSVSVLLLIHTSCSAGAPNDQPLHQGPTSCNVSCSYLSPADCTNKTIPPCSFDPYLNGCIDDCSRLKTEIECKEAYICEWKPDLSSYGPSGSTSSCRRRCSSVNGEHINSCLLIPHCKIFSGDCFANCALYKDSNASCSSDMHCVWSNGDCFNSIEKCNLISGAVACTATEGCDWIAFDYASSCRRICTSFTDVAHCFSSGYCQWNYEGNDRVCQSLCRYDRATGASSSNCNADPRCWWSPGYSQCMANCTIGNNGTTATANGAVCGKEALKHCYLESDGSCVPWCDAQYGDSFPQCALGNDCEYVSALTFTKKCVAKCSSCSESECGVLQPYSRCWHCASRAGGGCKVACQYLHYLESSGLCNADTDCTYRTIGAQCATKCNLFSPVVFPGQSSDGACGELCTVHEGSCIDSCRLYSGSAAACASSSVLTCYYDSLSSRCLLANCTGIIEKEACNLESGCQYIGGLGCVVKCNTRREEAGCVDHRHCSWDGSYCSVDWLGACEKMSVKECQSQKDTCAVAYGAKILVNESTATASSTSSNSRKISWTVTTKTPTVASKSNSSSFTYSTSISTSDSETTISNTITSTKSRLDLNKPPPATTLQPSSTLPACPEGNTSSSVSHVTIDPESALAEELEEKGSTKKFLISVPSAAPNVLKILTRSGSGTGEYVNVSWGHVESFSCVSQRELEITFYAPIPSSVTTNAPSASLPSTDNTTTTDHRRRLVTVTLSHRLFYCPQPYDVSVTFWIVREEEEKRKYVIPKEVLTSFGVTGTIVLAGGSFAASPSTLLQQQRTSGILALSKCDFSHDEPLERLASPLGLTIGSARGGYYRGAIIGNGILFLGFIMVSYLVVIVVHFGFFRRQAGIDHQGDEDSDAGVSKRAAL